MPLQQRDEARHVGAGGGKVRLGLQQVERRRHRQPRGEGRLERRRGGVGGRRLAAGRGCACWERLPGDGELLAGDCGAELGLEAVAQLAPRGHRVLRAHVLRREHRRAVRPHERLRGAELPAARRHEAANEGVARPDGLHYRVVPPRQHQPQEARRARRAAAAAAAAAAVVGRGRALHEDIARHARDHGGAQRGPAGEHLLRGVEALRHRLEGHVLRAQPEQPRRLHLVAEARVDQRQQRQRLGQQRSASGKASASRLRRHASVAGHGRALSRLELGSGDSLSITCTPRARPFCAASCVGARGSSSCRSNTRTWEGGAAGWMHKDGARGGRRAWCGYGCGWRVCGVGGGLVRA